MSDGEQIICDRFIFTPAAPKSDEARGASQGLGLRGRIEKRSVIFVATKIASWGRDRGERRRAESCDRFTAQAQEYKQIRTFRRSLAPGGDFFAKFYWYGKGNIGAVK